MSGGMFEKFYDVKAETVSATKKPIVKSRLQRKFLSAYDSAKEQRLDAEEQLANAQLNVEGYDINEILCHREKIVQADETMKAISDEYVVMFDEPFPGVI